MSSYFLCFGVKLDQILICCVNQVHVVLCKLVPAFVIFLDIKGEVSCHYLVSECISAL